MASLSSPHPKSRVSGFVVYFLSHVQLFATPWTAARQDSLFITNSRSLLKFMSIISVMPSNRLILCCPLLLPSILPSIKVFSNELALRSGGQCEHLEEAEYNPEWWRQVILGKAISG